MDDVSARQANPDESDETRTQRTEERKQEDAQFVPVIVKRIDESRRHPDDTLDKAVREGLEQIRRPTISLALSSVAAGLILGFTAMSVAVVATIVRQLDVAFLHRLATGLVYPLGFITCVLSGTQLFTEHTATALYPVLDKRATLLQLLRLWLIVVLGNLVGAAASATLLAVAEPVIQARDGYDTVARHLIQFNTLPLLASSVLAGWLMAQGAWLLLGTSHTSGQILSIYIVTFLIGIGGLHHSIAGSAELFAALLISETTYELHKVLRFIVSALGGNLIGGSLFVGVLNYAHIRGTQAKQAA